jgi:hypothetical protein
MGLGLVGLAGLGSSLVLNRALDNQDFMECQWCGNGGRYTASKGSSDG